MTSEEEQIQYGYSVWLELKDEYTYDRLMREAYEPSTHSMGEHKSTPPVIAIEMLEDYYNSEEKPATVDDWVWQTWSKNPFWFWITLYYSAIKTMIKSGIIEVYPDKSFSIKDPEKAERYIRMREEWRRMQEERERKRQEEAERKWQIFLSYHPEIADCLEENEQLIEQFSQMGRWLWVQGEAGRNKRLLENSIVLIPVYKRFGFEKVGTIIVGRIIKYLKEEGKVLVEYLCNSYITEVPDYFVQRVLVDERRNNIFLES